MNKWPVQDAKAHFSELLERCVKEGPQVVTKRGAEAAVLVPMENWRALTSAAQASLKSLLLSDAGRGDLSAAQRGNAKRRRPPTFN